MRFQNLKVFQTYLGSADPSTFPRVFLIAISDDFERRRAIESVTKLFPTYPFVSMSAVDGTLSELLTELESPSLFSSETAAIVDEVEKLPKKGAAALTQIVSSFTSGCLILGSRGKSPLFSLVEQNGSLLDLTDEKPWDREKRLAEHLSERAKTKGKRISSDVAPLLFERLDKNTALLEGEIDKLVCYVGDRPSIERADVLQICAASRSHTLWQIAEELVWEGGNSSDLNDGLIPILRSQMQMGLKIATLLEEGVTTKEIGARLPKIWPKTLERRIGQASRLGASYFRKGLDLLFRIESLSRAGSIDSGALLDFFRASIHGR